MTKQEKANCLRLRYRFAAEGDYLNSSNEFRHNQWINYVDKSKLTNNEKKICKKEFLTGIKR